MNAHNEQQSIIAGALFDLMGYLTCREKKLHLSASDDAAPAVEALTEWAEERGFDLDKARVTDWQAALAAQPSPVVKQNLTTQPAAAQEAVAWFTDDHLSDKSATTYDPSVAERWRKKGWPVTALYAAPVTAAPVDAEELARNRYRPVPDGLIAYRVVAGDGTRSLFSGTKDACNIVARKLTEAFLDGAYVASTPAAPGIDLDSLIPAEREKPELMMATWHEVAGWNACVAEIRRRIDASPKGEDSIARAFDRAVLEPMRREAKADSPKGGSEAVRIKSNCPAPSWMFPEDGEVSTDWRAEAAAWLEAQAIEQENTNAAYPAHAMAYPSWGDRVHWLRMLSAKVMQAQAGDAEVRP